MPEAVAFPPPQHLKLERMRVRAQFLFTAKGLVWRTHGVVIQARRCPSEKTIGAAIIIGFTATRKTGNAVKRNRARRRLRALAHTYLPILGVSGVNYVFIARMGTAKRSASALRKDVETALTSLRHRLIDET